ncbi:MAG: toll/interleukin-1 receptor domain-containing protein [Saprospiraceae bacterium]|nr:toll/interleukin-1 receptor domain-containing protein [Saprospiraceae bacterium]
MKFILFFLIVLSLYSCVSREKIKFEGKNDILGGTIYFDIPDSIHINEEFSVKATLISDAVLFYRFINNELDYDELSSYSKNPKLYKAILRTPYILKLNKTEFQSLAVKLRDSILYEEVKNHFMVYVVSIVNTIDTAIIFDLIKKIEHNTIASFNNELDSIKIDVQRISWIDGDIDTSFNNTILLINKSISNKLIDTLAHIYLFDSTSHMQDYWENMFNEKIEIELDILPINNQIKISSHSKKVQKVNFADKNVWMWDVIPLKGDSINLAIQMSLSKENFGYDIGQIHNVIYVKYSNRLEYLYHNNEIFLYLSWLFLILFCSYILLKILNLSNKRKPLYIFSYAWKNETYSEIENKIVELYSNLDKNKYKLSRDKEDLEHGDFITDFMKEIGKGDLIVIGLSSKYLKSKNCMFELCEIWRNSKEDINEFRNKVFILNLDYMDFNNSKLMEYMNYWKEERSQLENLIRRGEYNESNLVERNHVKNIQEKFEAIWNVIKGMKLEK